MSEDMTFLPKRDLLSLEELDRLCSAFVRLGTRKIRITGGEPLVRRGIMTLFRSLSRHIGGGALDELTVTTNGSQLARYRRGAARLRRRARQCLARHARSGKIPQLTRWGDLAQVMRGIDAADAPASRSRSTRWR